MGEDGAGPQAAWWQIKPGRKAVAAAAGEFNALWNNHLNLPLRDRSRRVNASAGPYQSL
jgi:hypothetical protein